MGVFKNNVGRSTNKTIMMRHIFKLILFIVIAVGIFASVSYALNNKNTDNKKKNSADDLNIKEDHNNTNKVETSKNIVDKKEQVETNKEESPKNIIEKLYGYFKEIPTTSYFENFYTEKGILSDNLSDEYMLSIAANNLEVAKCKGKYDYYVRGCFSDKIILEKIKEIFGKEVKIYDGLMIHSHAEGYTYSIKNSEFYHSSDGASWGEYIKNIFDYEMIEDRIYIYEVVVINNFPEDTYLDLSGNEINLPKGTSSGNIVNYKDKLDQFKWTFKKGEDGNYIFEKAEKIK